MNEAYLELKSPGLVRALTDIPTMQRWEILRRVQRPFTVAELAQEARTSLEEAQRSLDVLIEVGLVSSRPASSRRPKITYEAPMERLFVSWDSTDEEATAAWRLLRASGFAYSRRIQDEMTLGPGAEKFASQNIGGVTSVLLRKEDVSKLRETLREVYATLSAADQRARASADPEDCIPYHVAFNLVRMPESELPMAEFFVFEKTGFERERAVVESGADKILSPRELQIARLLASGKSRPDVAKEIGLTTNTVASLSKLIYRKLGVSSRAALTARMRLG